MSDHPNLEDAAAQLRQAEGILHAIVDQAQLNGPDVVSPDALIVSYTLLSEATTAIDAIVKKGGAQL